MTFILDIGGEGRHQLAWNLNPSSLKTLGPERGMAIPRHLAGRADAIPLPDAVVDIVIVERTPLQSAGLREILRVAKPAALIILRHAHIEHFDPHRLARTILPGQMIQRRRRIGTREVQESVFRLPEHRPVQVPGSGTLCRNGSGESFANVPGEPNRT